MLQLFENILHHRILQLITTLSPPFIIVQFLCISAVFYFSTNYPIIIICTYTTIVYYSIIKQVAHCDWNDGSRQNGIVAHLQRTGGSFGRRLFTYFLYKCCNFFFFHKCTPFFQRLIELSIYQTRRVWKKFYIF